MTLNLNFKLGLQVQREIGEFLSPDVPPQIPATTTGAAAARRPVRHQPGRVGGEEGALLHRGSRLSQLYKYTEQRGTR